MPVKRLSQNFLFDPSILHRIVEAAGVSSGDTVVEIGPGPGRLTRMLAEQAGRVVAIEVDRRLYEGLLEDLRGVGNVELHRGDALRFPYEGIGSQFKVVSNIPYHITTPIIFKLLEHRDRLVSMTLTVQKEVAQRICARPGGKQYGVLSIMVQYYGEAGIEFLIPRGAFRPVPRVDSACLHIRVRRSPAVRVRDEALFFRVVRAAFSQRRKTLANALKPIDENIAERLRAAGVEPSVRAERLSMEQFAAIANELSGRGVVA